MAAHPQFVDWSVTDEKVMEAVARIVAAADPLQIIAFGSRARGDHRPESDLDLAVILDAPEEEIARHLSYTVLQGLRLDVDLVVVSQSKYDLHRPWLNSIFHNIDREGVVLYDRNDPQSTHPDALHLGTRGRVDTPSGVA